jgi:hypothetical protein
MNYCTNKDCPAQFCARRLIKESEAPNTYDGKFYLCEDDGTFDRIAIVDGKQYGFFCEGYLWGAIA